MPFATSLIARLSTLLPGQRTEKDPRFDLRMEKLAAAKARSAQPNPGLFKNRRKHLEA